MNLSCQCGKTFRTAIAEARHRHNFPAMCKKVDYQAIVSMDVLIGDIVMHLRHCGGIKITAVKCEEMLKARNITCVNTFAKHYNYQEPYNKFREEYLNEHVFQTI